MSVQQAELHFPTESKHLAEYVGRCPGCSSYGILSRVFNGRFNEYQVRCNRSKCSRDCECYDTPVMRTSQEAVAHWKMTYILARR